MGGKTPGPGSASFAAADIQRQLARQTRGARRELFQQLAETLATGRVPEARTPEVQRAVEAAAQQASAGVRGAEEQVAKAGLGRSSYGIQTIEQARGAGGQAVGGIPTEAAAQIIGQAPGLVNAAQNIIARNLGVQQQGQAASAMAGAQAQAQTLGAATAGATALVSIIAAAAL